MSVEEWRPVVGIEGYEVSSLGRVRSWRPWGRRPAPRILTATVNPCTGYPTVGLAGKSHTVHVLVAAAFIGPRPADRPEIRHLDGDASNAAVTNLKYGTKSENTRDSVLHGTHNQASKTTCPQGHPYDEKNTRRDEKGHRDCRTCAREDTRRYRAKLRARAS